MKGRPTIYSEELVAKAQDYSDNLPTDEVVHSIEGLALHMGITRSTIYAWIDDEGKEDFSYIVSAILAKQGRTLVNRGLSNIFNSKITAVMLSKHDYREGHEMTGKDGEKLISDATQSTVNAALLKYLNGTHPDITNEG